MCIVWGVTGTPRAPQVVWIIAPASTTSNTPCTNSCEVISSECYSNAWSLGVLLGTFVVVISIIFIGTPFPHITYHIIQTIAIGRETTDRRSASSSIVCLVTSDTSPWVFFPCQSAANSFLPFSFSWQAFSIKLRIRRRTIPLDHDYGMVFIARFRFIGVSHFSD